MRSLPFAIVGRTVVTALLAAVGGLSACDSRTSLWDPEPGSDEPDSTTSIPTTGSPIAPVDITVDAGAESPTAAGPGVEQDLLARWNAAASAAEVAFDFHWATFNQFPHPTFKGGSAEAYRAFAAVLLAFFQAGDNFEFLTRNQLCTFHLVYVFPNGGIGFDTSFQALAMAFAAPDGFGAIPFEVRQALQGFADRMQPTSPVRDPLPDGAASDYPTMCRHYCEALFETGIYSCVARTGDATACAQLTPSADQCYELRCAPSLVPASLCLTQCDSLGAAYETVCADGTGPGELCAASVEDRVGACRDGC